VFYHLHIFKNFALNTDYVQENGKDSDVDRNEWEHISHWIACI